MLIKINTKLGQIIYRKNLFYFKKYFDLTSFLQKILIKINIKLKQIVYQKFCLILINVFYKNLIF